jgi:hypothetical protein
MITNIKWFEFLFVLASCFSVGYFAAINAKINQPNNKYDGGKQWQQPKTI